MTRAPFSSPLAESLADDALERLLRYVRIDTQADHAATGYPSTAKQLDLSRLLVEELHAIGIADARLEESNYVIATLPGIDAEGAPTLGLIAHVDTSPDESGTNVQPQVVREYDGGEILVGPTALRPAESPLLAERVGHDIVTTDGTTLLGADDKAGVAEIMAAVAHLHREGGRRAPVRIAFTVDEEVGRGTERFDIPAFGADFAYTVDGAHAGDIDDETFSGDEVTVTFRGRMVHTGVAKEKLVNAIKLAAAFVARLPPELSPEATDERQGFVHPRHIDGDGAEATVILIARDFDREGLQAHVDLIRRLAEETAAREPGAEAAVTVQAQYRNMKEWLRDRPQIVDAAKEAVRRAGLEPASGSIRGGTDGSRLTEMGLPTPNLFTGGNEYHSVREWISVQDMAAATATIVELVRLWAEPEWRLT